MYLTVKVNVSITTTYTVYSLYYIWSIVCTGYTQELIMSGEYTQHNTLFNGLECGGQYVWPKE